MQCSIGSTKYKSLRRRFNARLSNTTFILCNRKSPYIPLYTFYSLPTLLEIADCYRVCCNITTIGLQTSLARSFFQPITWILSFCPLVQCATKPLMMCSSHFIGFRMHVLFVMVGYCCRCCCFVERASPELQIQRGTMTRAPLVLCQAFRFPYHSSCSVHMSFTLDVPANCVADMHGLDVFRFAPTKQELSALRCC